MPTLIVSIIGGVVVIFLIGFDIYLAADKVSGNTWSEILRTWAVVTPVIPWACGVLSGHFFHPIENLKPVLGTQSSITLLIWLTCVVGIIGLGLDRAGYPVPPWIVFLPALVVGSLLWPV